MSSDSPSLLTKTQRRRIRDQFADLDEAKTRRDQQRIRERIAAGAGDFGLLVGYPDDQLEQAFSDYDDEELLDALADGRLVLERIRERRGLDRERVVERARERARDEATASPDAPTLGRLDFETAAEQRRRLATELRDRLGPSLWGRRANRLLRFAAAVFLPVFLMWFFDQLLGTALLDAYTPVWGGLTLVGVPVVAAALAIKLAQVVKYDVVPLVRALVTDPDTVRASLYQRVVVNPRRTLRRSWDDL